MRRFIGYMFLLGCMPIFAFRDPTQPPSHIRSVSKKGEENREFVLNAVIHGKKRLFTVINGKKLTVGDKISGSTVIKIEKTRVHLKRGKKIIILSFSGIQR